MNWNPLTWFASTVVDSVSAITAETEALAKNVVSLKTRAETLSTKLTDERIELSSKHTKRIQSLKDNYDRMVSQADTTHAIETVDIDGKLSRLSESLSVIEKVVETLS